MDTTFTRQDGTLMVRTRICVPDVDNLRREILDEVHNTPYAIHLGTTKMYQTLCNILDLNTIVHAYMIEYGI